MTKILLHGGAGRVSGERRKMTASVTFDIASEIYDLLEDGSSALDAVQEAVRLMEDHPIFNAGLGSVVTENGELEMDALLIDGQTQNMGGVIGVSNVKNPIVLCRAILDHSPHLLFTGNGAHQFAEEHGITLTDPEDLITPRIRERLVKFKESKSVDTIDPEGRQKYGTVGAVAMDQNGNLAAATSTGGTLGKKKGRVGDTPIVGAGTYADNEIACSATGVGEYIIQSMLSLRVKYQLPKNDCDLKKATESALSQTETKFGTAGIIVMTSDGQYYTGHTTPDLIWAFKDGNRHIHWLS